MTNKEKVDQYIKKHEKWSSELSMLRKLLNSTELEEEVKWGMPAYTLNKKNVLGIAGFKNHCGVWFHNGVFLKDKHKILRNAQEGKTMRQLRIEKGDKLDQKIILAYIKEAIQNQKDGKEIKAAKPSKKLLAIPELVEEAMDDVHKTAFEKLSTSARNQYIEYITSAKREATQKRRLTKSLTLIAAGKGLHDEYK